MLTAINAAAVTPGAGASANGAASLLGQQQTHAPAPFSDLMAHTVGQVDQLEEQANTAVSGLDDRYRRGCASGDDCH